MRATNDDEPSNDHHLCCERETSLMEKYANQFSFVLWIWRFDLFFMRTTVEKFKKKEEKIEAKNEAVLLWGSHFEQLTPDDFFLTASREE